MAKYSKRFTAKLKDALDFTMAEIRGIIVLAIIICLVITATCIVNYISLHKSCQFQPDKSTEIADFFAYQKHLQDSVTLARKQKYTRSDSHYMHPHAFCADTMSINDWMHMGFNLKKATQINKYLSKGGKIRTAEDLKKIYCINDYEYQQLKPYIQFAATPATLSAHAQHNISYTTPQTAKMYKFQINLNAEDSLGLLRVPKVGPKTASKIIRYRNKLGGYYKIEQLQEIYGMDSLQYEQIKSYFFIDTSLIVKININTADIKTMAKHPYIDYFVAKSLVIYREQNGPYTSIEDIKKVIHFYDELYDKLLHYISI